MTARVSFWGWAALGVVLFLPVVACELAGRGLKWLGAVLVDPPNKMYAAIVRKAGAALDRSMADE